jgi:hypothetical protein
MTAETDRETVDPAGVLLAQVLHCRDEARGTRGFYLAAYLLEMTVLVLASSSLHASEATNVSSGASTFAP